LLYFYTAGLTWEDVTLFRQLGDHLSATYMYVCYKKYDVRFVAFSYILNYRSQMFF